MEGKSTYIKTFQIESEQTSGFRCKAGFYFRIFGHLVLKKSLTVFPPILTIDVVVGV